MKEKAPVETSPIKGEASHIQDLSPEKSERYENFTTVIEVGSKSVIGATSLVGVLNFLDRNEEYFNSNLIYIASFVAVGILGYLYAEFRKKATSMVTEV